ncbi:MAG: hypothetical protein SVW77_00225 [Candidatus Nanohaloarchaea archaeon]|nr:hypothetical protein [Candidatus Nanohaloarchaea archaeon]
MAPRVADDLLIEHGYDLDRYIEGAVAFARETGRPVRPVFYGSVFDDFTAHSEDGLPTYQAGPLQDLLDRYQEENAPTGETVTLRCLVPDAEPDAPGDLPPHTALTYVPGEGAPGRGRLEISTADEPADGVDLDTVVQYFSP